MPTIDTLDDLTGLSAEQVARRFQGIIAATDWAPATQKFDLAFAELVQQAYRAPRLFTYVDLFCGAGGSSIGLTMAGGLLLLAANHDPRAVDTHQTNFRDADHRCVDLDHYDMRNLPDADVLWGSPICTEISPSAGRQRPAKPKQQRHPDQEELLKFGPVSDKTFERTRATFYDIVRAVEVHKYRYVVVENVPAAAIEWFLFWWWMQGMMQLGYQWQILCVSAAHVGDEFNPHAAQRRDRMYVVFNREGTIKPDLAVRPQSWCTEHGLVEGVQSWKKSQGTRTASGVLLPVGTYGRNGQYWYRCPHHNCGMIVAPLERPAASIIDWTDLGIPIGDRAAHGETPLVDNTLKRVLRGMQEYPHRQPGEMLPAEMIQEAGWSAYLDSNGGSWNTEPGSVAVPFRTRTTKQWEGLVTSGVVPLIDVARNHAVPQPAAHNPLATVSTSRHNALVVPYYRTGVARPASQPFGTMATRDTFGLASPNPSRTITMDDVMRAKYRMIKSHEAALSQRFPRFYNITGNDGEQMAQVGNAVPTNVAQMIGQRIAVALNRTSAHV